MTKLSRITSNCLRLAVLAMAVAGAGSAVAASANAPATGTVIAGISISKVADLAFGSFAAGTGGSVTITPGGTRTVSGNVLAVAGPATTAAKFDVTGQSGMGYSISLSATPLSANGGADQMIMLPVGDVTASGITTGGPAAGTLTGGAQSIYVGGVLTVASNQAPGAYAGTVTATVDYN